MSRIALSPKSWVEVEENGVKATTEQLEELFAARPAKRDIITMFGKSNPIPRDQKLYGEMPYSFSGMRLVAEPVLPTLVQTCLAYAREHAPDYAYNGALVNWYMDGNDSIGFHSDDEKDMDPEAPIFSFSFGGVRTFEIKAKNETVISGMKIRTMPGLVIIMGGNMQKEFLHGIPKEKNAEPRINITIRAFQSNKRSKLH
jgi:alkylated DNA repair dioxygenase AlkB